MIHTFGKATLSGAEVSALDYDLCVTHTHLTKTTAEQREPGDADSMSRGVTPGAEPTKRINVVRQTAAQQDLSGIEAETIDCAGYMSLHAHNRERVARYSCSMA